MTIHKMKPPVSLHRIVSAAVLVFIFFLPLHFHSPFAVQIAKECSCVHGTRQQLLPADAAARLAQVPLITVLVARHEFLSVGDWSTLQHVRAPPVARPD